MGPLGWQETIFIFVLALLVFGPKKLPELGKTLAKAMTEFRRASNELKATWDREMQSMEKEAESLKEVTHSYQNQIASSYNDTTSYDSDSGYEYGYDYESEHRSLEPGSATVGASETPGAEQTVHTDETAAQAPGSHDSAPASGTVTEHAGTPAPAPVPEGSNHDGPEVVRS